MYNDRHEGLADRQQTRSMTLPGVAVKVQDEPPDVAMQHMCTCSNAVRADSSTFPSSLLASVMSAAPDLPLARPMTVSFVLVSPSTVICK